MWGSVAMVLAIALVGVPTAASANTITVDDAGDPDGTGCTLEHAIIAANTNLASGNCSTGSGSGTDVIDVNLSGLSTITLTGALPAITTNIDIVGPGSSQLSVSGDGQFRAFRYTNGSTVNTISGLNITDGFCDDTCPEGAAGAGIISTGTLTLTDVTLTSNTVSESGGTDAFPEGGAIRNNGGTLHLVLSSVSGNTASAMNATNQNASEGGGIFNNGALTIDRSTVNGNQALASTVTGNSATAAGGGIVQFNGSISISRSTISGNSAAGTGGTAGNNANGGGIAMGNSNDNTMALDRATVTGNSVSAGPPINSQNAGGIMASGGAGSAFTVVSSTISGNTSPSSTANVLFGGETQSIKNSIISRPLGGGLNCGSASTASQGFNLEDTNTCGFGQPGDKPNTDPMLDTLGANGGPTMTMAFITGSPAIDAGLSSVGETADQRGLTRPLDLIAASNAPGSDGTDIGALEQQGPAVTPPVTTPPTTTPPTTTAPRKKCKKRKHRASSAKRKCRKKKK